jgi:hypothetical protein
MRGQDQLIDSFTFTEDDQSRPLVVAVVAVPSSFFGV